MTFVIRMIGRELRASWRRLLFFFLCVALGVGSIAAMRSVIQSVRAALAREARGLTSADVVIQGTQAFDPALVQRLEPRFQAHHVQAATDIVETPTMVRPADQAKAVARMVELQAVAPGYPFYGQITLADGRPYSHALLEQQGVIVRPELLAQLDLAVGDRIVIGRATFEIRAVLASEPGRRVGIFSLGPRVIMDAADLPATQLLSFGSRARFQRMLKLPEAEVEPLARELREMLKGGFVSARSYRDTEDQVGRQLRTAENYLGLVGYVMVILGGIGVWSVTRVFMQQKLQSIAVLKCVGASVWQVLSVYVAQVLLLGAWGSALGLLLAIVLLRAIPPDLVASWGHVDYGLTWTAGLQAFGIGVLVSLLFALVPLLEIRHVRPLLLLRDESESGPLSAPDADGRRPGLWSRLVARIDWLQVIAAVAVTGALVALAAWQAGSWRVGGIVSGGFVATALVLHLLGLVLVRLVRPLRTVRWFPMRHAVNGFGRPGHQTRVILLSVGLGSFFIIGIRSLELNLLREFTVALRPDAPDLFLIDVQQDQEPGVREFLTAAKSDPSPRLIPVLRARITGVKGRELNLASVEDVRERGSLSREFVITYRDGLQPNEKLTNGGVTLWTGARGSAPEVSIAKQLQDSAGLHIGDLVRFDVMGRPIDATITSVRDVDWSDSRAGGFMFVFRPDVLERAPHAFMGVMRGPATPAARARLQRDLVERFPNVSVIDVREVLTSIEAVVANVRLAVSVVGGVALVSGLLILIGAVAMTKFQRLREVALLKTLGASSRIIAAMLVIEYGLLGALAGAVGALAAVALSWTIATRVLQIAWEPAIATHLAGVLITAVVVGGVGVLASLDVLRRKPLAVLRAG
jgi:putative ABC transport system permease protein